MSTSTATFRTLVALALVQVLLACGGGGSSSGSTPSITGIEGSGISVAYTGNVVSSGQITGFGSIFVNGIEYSLDRAAIQVNGQNGASSALAIGQVVTVAGRFGDRPTIASASTVSYAADLIGPVSAVDAAQRRITVMGQVVSIDDGQIPTIIDASIAPATLAGLSVGLPIEVSGFTNSQGILSARYVRARSSGTPYAVTGTVERVDTTLRNFTIRALGVDYSAANLGAMPGGTLRNGDVVRVEGLQFAGNGALQATRVVPYSTALPGMPGDTAIVEGWITRYVSNTDFDVNGRAIVGSAQTQVSPPPSAAGDPFGISTLRLDRFVTVYGQLRSDGRIDAVQITIANNVHANLAMPSVCSASGVCSAETQIVIDGAPASMAALKPGDLLTSYNYWLPDYTRMSLFKNVSVPGTQEFRRKSMVVEHTLRGPLESVDPDTGTLRIMGQTVVTGLLETHVFGLTGSSGNAYWRDQKVLRTLVPGQRLEISGYETPHGEIVATGVESGAGKDLRVIGTARLVNAATGTFGIQALTIDFHNAFMDGFAGAVLRDGDRVLVSGDTLDGSGALVARRVSLLGNGIRGARGTVLRYDGPITRYASLWDFDVAGLSVALTPLVTSVDGCGRMRVNAFISIFGVMDSNGQIRSNLPPTLWCTSSGSLSLRGRIEAIDTVRGLVDVLGVRLAVFDQTLISNSTGSTATIVDLAALRVGDDIVASGQLGTSDRNWTRVAINVVSGGQPPNNISGDVQAFSASTGELTIAGVRVRTGSQTSYQDSCGYTRTLNEAYEYLSNLLASPAAPDEPRIATANGTWTAPWLLAASLQLAGMPVREGESTCLDY